MRKDNDMFGDERTTPKYYDEGQHTADARFRTNEPQSKKTLNLVALQVHKKGYG